MRELAIRVTLCLFLALLVLGVTALIEPKVRAADNTCPVLKATPDGKGGAMVVFDCGESIVTIQEPVWP